MINEFCPKCGVLTNMDVSTVENREKDKEDKTFKVKTTNYHCSMCHTFVRNEDEKILIKDE